MSSSGSALPERIARFVRRPADDDFAELARAAFAFQYERIPAYRTLCDHRGVSPAELGDWRRAPPVPTLAFKSTRLAAAPAVVTFHSSGTTGERRSVHHHPYPELYGEVIEATFPQACLNGLDAPPPILALVPSREQAPDSSLAFLCGRAIERWGGPGSATAFHAAGVDVGAARSWLGARQRDGRPALVLATAFALARLLDALARQDLRFLLPAGSRIFETGGFKGRERELERGELLEALATRLGVPPAMVVREYGMTELTSHFYTRVLDGGDPDLFVPPPWTRVRILEPGSLEEAIAGVPGLIAVFDLANVGSAVHVLTEDLGVADGDGFRLAGRAAGAELRGCSLTVEELESGR